MALSARERAREREQWTDEWRRRERAEIFAFVLFALAIVIGISSVVLGVVALVEGWL